MIRCLSTTNGSRWVTVAITLTPYPSSYCFSISSDSYCIRAGNRNSQPFISEHSSAVSLLLFIKICISQHNMLTNKNTGQVDTCTQTRTHNPARRQTSCCVTTFPIVCEWKQPFILNHMFLRLPCKHTAVCVSAHVGRHTVWVLRPQELIRLQGDKSMSFQQRWMSLWGSLENYNSLQPFGNAVCFFLSACLSVFSVKINVFFTSASDWMTIQTTKYHNQYTASVATENYSQRQLLINIPWCVKLWQTLKNWAKLYFKKWNICQMFLKTHHSLIFL